MFLFVNISSDTWVWPMTIENRKRQHLLMNITINPTIHHLWPNLHHDEWQGFETPSNIISNTLFKFWGTKWTSKYGKKWKNVAKCTGVHRHLPHQRRAYVMFNAHLRGPVPANPRWPLVCASRHCKFVQLKIAAKSGLWLDYLHFRHLRCKG